MIIYSYLFFSACIIYLLMGIYVLRLDPRAALNRVFFVLCLIFGFWSFDNVLFQLIKDKNTLIFYHKLFVFSWCFHIGVIIHFTLILIKKNDLLKKRLTYVLLYLPGFIFTFKEIITGFIEKDYIITGFGWRPVYNMSSPWYLAYEIYYTVPVLIGIFLVWLWGKNSESVREKKQARIIIISGFIGLAVSYIQSSLLPRLNINFLPPMATITILIWIFGMWLAIVKYRLMNFTPAALVEEILSGMLDLLVLISLDGEIVLTNRQTDRILGYSERELTGKKIDIIVFEKELIKEEMKRVKEGKSYSEPKNFSFISKSGGIIPIILSSIIIKNEEIGLDGILLLGYDKRQENQLRLEIESRKQAEYALRESEENLHNLMENIAAAVFITQDTRIVYANQSMEKLLELNRNVLCRLSFKDLLEHVSPDYRNTFVKNIYEREKGNALPIRYEFKWDSGNGSEKWIDLITTTILYKGRNAVLVTGFDITGQKKSEVQLNNLYRAVEQSTSIVIVLNIKGNIEYINPKFLEITGFQLEEVIGKSLIGKTVNEELRATFKNIINTVVSGKDSKGEIYTRKRNGKGYWLLYTASPIKNPEGIITHLLGVGEDITYRKKTEEEMLKINKLDSLGVLAGGMGHDLNNVLTAIIGNISLAKIYLKPDEPAYDFLFEAEKASFRARNLSWQFLTMSKGVTTVKKLISTESLLKETVDFTLNRTNVKYVFIIPERLWNIEADEVQFCQLIENLIINACQAMPEGGELKIKCENYIYEERNQTIPIKSGNYVKISFQDSGIGIPKENLSRIFDPYFTTKEMGHGLGLTICYSIVKRHDGYIGAESRYGTGSTFFIYLPASNIDTDKEPI